MGKGHILTLAFLFLFGIAHSQLPNGFIRQEIATGLNPTSIAIGKNNTLYITEKNGTIRIIRDDVLLEEPLLSIEVDDSNERGLGHMVLHPDFENNGWFYIYYAVPLQRFNRVSRFQAIGDKIVPGSEKIILDLDQMGSDIHNGGDMVFGVDGYLYIATGDGGRNWLGEDPGSTNAKILRVDDEGLPVPDNPMYHSTYLRSNLVYATGMRNPFTMTIHPETGDIYVNDVGGSKFEEINRIERGAFYGWPRLEGKNLSGMELPDEYMDPIYHYGHTNGYCCIVGSAIYAPPVQQFPDTYKGRYFYSDYCKGVIRMLDLATNQDKGIFMTGGDRIIDIEVDDTGNMYYLERRGRGDGSMEDNTGTNEGALWKISYTGAGTPFISVQPRDVFVSAGEDATFSISASGALPLSFQWYVNGAEIADVNDPTLLFEHAATALDGSEIYCKILNSFGEKISDTVSLHVTDNRRPVPQISSPVEWATYAAGEAISFSGTAHDEEDGPLAAPGLEWRIDFHHGTHSHPALSWTQGITSGSWEIPVVGETASDVWYRIYLRATDSEGLTQTSYRDIFPKLGSMTVQSKPAGLQINLDGAPALSPYEVEGVHGVSRYITAPSKQVKGDSVYFFKQWHDGITDRNREIKASMSHQTFEALYEGIPAGRGTGLTAIFYENILLEGTPVDSMIDPLIDHHYFSNAPHPWVGKDFFSIRWEGYIQAYHSGEYTFTLLSDDGSRLQVNHQPLIDIWEAGVQYGTANIYLEGGRLYPISLQLYDEGYSSQIKLRWSSEDFPQEVIPTSQLYPARFISNDTITGFRGVRNISNDELWVFTESFKETELDIFIYTLAGQVVDHPVEKMQIGPDLLRINISYLPPGIYFLKGLSRVTGEKEFIKFVKVK